MPLVKNFELTTEDFEFGFDDGQGNAITTDTIEQLPTLNLGPALRDYLLSIPKIRSFFREEVNYYNRQDYEVRTLPALNVYQADCPIKGPYGWADGSLEMRIILPASHKREIVPDVAVRITDYLTLIFNNFGSIEFVSQYVPGLVNLGFNPTYRYSKAYILDDKKVDAYVVECVANYKISMIEYYESLWSKTEYLGSNIKVNIAP